MRLLFVLLVNVFIFTSGCSEPTDPSASGNSITLTYASVDNQQATLTLSNSTDAPVYYFGFGQANPLKTVEVLTDTGWSAIIWDWCGTGAELQQVKPHSAAEILAPALRRNVKTRVTFSIAQSPEEEYHTLSSNEFVIP